MYQSASVRRMLCTVELTELVVSLLAPLEIGSELIAGVRLVGVSSELGLRIALDDGGALVHVEIFPAAPARAHAARSDRFLFAYRSSQNAIVDPARGLMLCRAIADRVGANEERVMSAWSARDPGKSSRIREVRGGVLLERAGTVQEPLLTMSPYVGCLIGCRFCYAQERVGIARAIASLPDAPWGSYVDARIDAPDLLARELESAPDLPIKLCPIVSDPYHAIEAQLKLTRSCLEVLASQTRPVLVLTRAALIERDLDVLARLRRCYAGFSLPTIDDEVRAHFEPRAASIAERLRILGEMRSRGIETIAVVQPMLPGSVEALADVLAEHVRSVSLDVLRGEYGSAPLFDVHPYAREDGWQRERLEELRSALQTRGVAVWRGELPALA